MTRLLHSALAVVLAVAFAAAPDAQRRPVDADPGGQSEPPVTNGQDADDRDPGGQPYVDPLLGTPEIDDRDDPDATSQYTPVVADFVPMANGRTAETQQAAARRFAARPHVDDAVLFDGRTAETTAFAEARYVGEFTGPLDDGRPPGSRPAPVLEDGAPEAFAPEPVAARALDAFDLSVVTPNPAGEAAAVVVTVDALAEATVLVYDVRGRMVARAFDGVVSPEAPTRVALDTSALAAGAYVVVLHVADKRTTQTFQVVR